MSDAQRPSSSEEQQGSPEELQRLLDLLADDRLQPSDADRLEALISSSKESRWKYIEMAALCAELEWVCGDTLQVGWDRDLGRKADQQTHILRPREPIATSRMAVAFTAGLAAAVLLLAAVGSLSWPGGAASPPPSAAGRTTQPAEVVDVATPRVAATLTGMVDCEWASDLEAPTYGEQLRTNRLLKLDAGLAQLTFESGAKLILQGPAEFLIRSDMKGTLSIGKLTAVVPQQAHGFSVATPSAEVVDLGTEFGIEVDGTGRTEVHVFEGEVISWQADSQGDIQGEALSLTTNAAASYELDSTGPKNLAADSSKFVRDVTPQLAEGELPQLPVHRKLALWLAADVLVKRDEANRVISWRDITVGDNQMEDDAWQHDQSHRPTWVESSIGGMPAVRFDGRSSYLVTTPIPTTKDQTLFFVFQRNAETSDSYQKRQLINYNGPPYTLPTNSRTFRILQIDDLMEPGAYRAFVYAGVDEQRAIHFGSVRMLKPRAPKQPLIMSYTYNTQENAAELIVNGESQGVTTGLSGADFVSRKILGKHPLNESYFDGDIAEVLIYNSGLSPRKVERVTSYLSQKYSIELATQE